MIDDRTARRIACDWHSGRSSPLYALCSTGSIVVGVGREIANDMLHAWNPLFHTQGDYQDLKSLMEYVDARPLRGPIAGWGQMPW